jgi:hypothetical protein
MAYNPPPSPWSVAGIGGMRFGDYIRDRNQQRKQDERVALLDERQAKLDEAEGIDRAINRARLGVVEVDPSDPQGRAIGRDAIRAQGVEPPSLDPKALAQSTLPAHLGGLAASALRGEPMPGLGGSEPSTEPPRAFSAGDYLRGLKPPVMESNLQRVPGAGSLYIDPSRTPEGRQRVEREVERAAEMARVEQERKRARDAAYQSAISAGASEQEANSFADAQAVGVTPYSYAPRTREQMFADLRERERITNPQGRGSDVNWQTFESGGKLYERNPRTGQTRAVTLPGGAPAAAKGETGDIPMANPESRTRILMGLPRAEQALGELERFLIDPESEDLRSVPETAFLDRITPGRYFQPEDVQAYKAAGERLASAILRVESGAAVTEDEARRYAQQFVPQPSDKPETARQKLEVLRSTIERMRALGGLTSGEQPVGARPPNVGVHGTGHTNPYRR